MKTHPNAVIYLDHNVMSICKQSRWKDGGVFHEDRLKLFVIIKFLQRHNFSFPYSDNHIYELLNTGMGGSLSNDQKEIIIQEDLKHIKLLTESKRINIELDNRAYIKDQDPFISYEAITEITGSHELLFNLINSMPPETLKYYRERLGFNNIQLNSLETADQADNLIFQTMDAAYKQLQESPEFSKEDNQHAILLAERSYDSIEQAEVLFLKQIETIEDFGALPDEIRTQVTFTKEKLKKAKEDAKKGLDDLKQNGYLVEYRKNLTTMSQSSEFNLENTLKNILKDHDIPFDEELAKSSLRGFAGFGAKKLGKRNAQVSDHFDNMHARFIPWASYFVVNGQKEVIQYKKRYGHLTRENNILEVSEFIEMIEKKFNLSFNINPDESLPVKIEVKIGKDQTNQ
jgi:hypothetical protein